MLVACLSALATTQADPDLWGHVRFGADIVAAKSVPRTDPYSFTSDRAWVNHEWLAEVLMFGAWRIAGSFGLVLLKLAVIVGLFVVARRQISKLPAMVADRFTALLVIGVLMRVIPIRPQLFSLLLFGVLLALLTAADRAMPNANERKSAGGGPETRGVSRSLLLVPMVMAVWANVHGGWLAGGGILAAWVAFTVVSRGLSWRNRTFIVLTGVAAGLATMLNPYGIGLWRFLYDTVGFGRADVVEWQPIYRMPMFSLATWLLVAGAGIAIILRARRTIGVKYPALVALLAAASFRVSRLDAFFAIAVVMLLAPLLREHVRPAAVHPAKQDPTGRRVAVAASLAALVAMVAIGFGLEQRSRCIKIDRSYMPEPEAAAFVLANHLSGRMVTWFNWGEYAIWHFSPATRVSIDGRRETVYTDATVQANHRFFFQEANAGLAYADAVRADFVWTPNALLVARRLEQGGWARIFRGPMSSIFARHPGGRYVHPAVGPAGGCYPGP